MNQVVFSYQYDTEDDVLVLDEKKPSHKIVLFNDDVNTFDWVITSLIQICNHDETQAEQCAHIVHFNGKCIVKEGDFRKLEPMCTALLERGLSATID